MKISIIIPVYNVEKYVEQAVKSAMAQTIKDVEIILVDDGSTDKSGYLCDQMAQQDNRIKVIHKENGGLGTARNAGLDIATGDYIGFLDSDDYIDTDMYEVMINNCEECGAKIACCSRYEFSNENDEKKTGVIPYGIYSPEELLKVIFLGQGISFSACDKVFCRELFETQRFPNDNRPSEDTPCIYQVIRKSEKCVHIGYEKYHYRYVQGSLSNLIFSRRKMSYVEYAEDIYKDVIENHTSEKMQVIFYFAQTYMFCYGKLYNVSRYMIKSEYMQLSKILLCGMRKLKKDIVKNIYISNKTKGIYFFMTWHLYPLFSIIRGKKGHDRKNLSNSTDL